MTNPWCMLISEGNSKHPPRPILLPSSTSSYDSASTIDLFLVLFAPSPDSEARPAKTGKQEHED